MEREYESGTANSVSFFVGTEVEQTPAHGMKTLFVVGVHDSESIIEMAKANCCEHIYFGANQSFRVSGTNDSVGWSKWEFMIEECLEMGFWCTLDFDVSHVEGLLESGLPEKRKFIPQISVKIPYLQLLGYNATIKIDDKDFDASNPGVWCMPLNKLTKQKHFTDWDQYTKDQIIS